MTGFLCALGSVALQNRTMRSNALATPAERSSADSRKSSVFTQEAEKSSKSLFLIIFYSLFSCTSKFICCFFYFADVGEAQYCPVTVFIGMLLKLLVCNNEKFGTQMQKHVKELVGHELNPAIYPILFEQIKLFVDKFFDTSGQVPSSKM